MFAIPLLVETGRVNEFDTVVVIDAPNVLRRRWIQERSGLSDGEIDAIFEAQASREQRLAVATDVLTNAGTIEAFLQQVDALHTRLLALAGTRKS